MLTYIIRRLIQAFFVIIGITTITFFLLRIIPGDPCRPQFREQVPPEVWLKCREDLGLNQPIWVQYGKYILHIVQGDLGDSIFFRRPALEIYLERFPATLFLAVYSMCIAVAISLPLGILSAVKKDSIFDYFVRWLTTLTLSMPAFWLALLLMLLFGIRLKLFPISGYGSTFWEHLYYLFLPSFTISVGVMTYLTRSLRNSILEIIGSDYVRTAHAKGLKKHTIMFRYVLRNGLISYVTILGLGLAGMVGGSVIIETVYSVPGVGSILIKAISQRDYTLVQNSTLVYALLVQVINLGIDMIYPVLDPRITYAE